MAGNPYAFAYEQTDIPEGMTIGQWRAERAALRAPGARGDEEQLYRDHAADLRSAVGAHLRTCDAVVDDACSFAWMQLLRRQPDRPTIGGWLYRVAVREGYRLLRQQRRVAALPTADDGTEIDQPHPVSLDDQLQARDALACVAALPPLQGRFLALQASGHSYQEIAQMTGRSASSVNKRLTRARARVREAR